jgi:DNA-binding NarL/FixJ family response regulator
MIVDDHAILLKSLAFFLRTQPDLEIVGEARSGEEALEKIEAAQPDLVLMDLLMPGMNGIETTRRMLQLVPGVKVLVLTSLAEQDHVRTVLQEGAAGYLLKDMEPDQLVEAIKGAFHGNVQLHPDIKDILVAGLDSHYKMQSNSQSDSEYRPDSGKGSSLTVREKEVLGAIARGLSNKEIAAALFISEKTVKTHVSNILGKLELDDRTQAALFAVKHGFDFAGTRGK